MRILISYDDRIRHDSTGIYFKRAFEKVLGKENVTHLYNEFLGTVVPGTFDYHFKIDDGLSKHRWDKRLKPWAYYVIDSHLDLDWRQEIVAEVGGADKLFFAQKPALLAPWDCDDLVWNPLAADEEIHSPTQKWEKKYDTCFIGHFHSQYAEERARYCDALFAAIPNLYFGRRFFQEMADKFAQTRLVFNKALNQDINMRFYEAQMSGSALLTDRIEPDMKDAGYLDGRHYIGYSSIDEMLEKARYYLKNESEREAIAAAGRAHTVANHTYIHRVKAMLEAVSKKIEAKKQRPQETEVVCP